MPPIHFEMTTLTTSSQALRLRARNAPATSGCLNRERHTFPLTLVLLAFCLPTMGCAHGETGTAGGFVSGFTHPLGGLDHIVAMVAVGLWGAFLGGRAMWTLPVVFPVVMALGGALGVVGVPVPGVEAGIALSGIILGLMVAFAARGVRWCSCHCRNVPTRSGLACPS